MSLEAALERLKTLHPRTIDLSINRTLRICEDLGRPQDRLPPTIHIAGTNGKGSTLAFLRAMAEAQGLSVHVYSSPHLVRFSERIRLAGTLISDAYLLDLIERLERVNQGAELTFFEATTALAFMAFAETPADLLLLETGLGGIYDSTNIVETPALTLISPIDYDHQAFLGHDLATIAAQKAGIIKSGVPVVSAAQADEALGVIERQALRHRAPLRLKERDFQAYMEHGRLIFEGRDKANHEVLLDLSPPSLLGAHQIDNAALSIAAALSLGLSASAIDKGLRTATWAGRMQKLTSGPLVEAQPQAEIWLDGGHNPHAAKALRLVLDEISALQPLPVYLICGLLNTKDSRTFFAAFSGLELDISCIGFNSENAIPSETLCAQAREQGLKATAFADIMAAISSLPSGPKRILICGSLYLVGEVLGLSPETYPV